MEGILENVSNFSNPSDLRITDMRFVNVVGLPMHCILMKLYTNQGLVGYGEVRDGASKLYALQLKRLLIGENPCDVDRLFRRIKQFGGPARQAGGVSGVEVALWDLAGKAYGLPVYKLLGGKFRDKIRMYCDTDVNGKHTGTDMGNALKKRMEMGYTFLKMDLGLGILSGVPGTVSAPLGYMEQTGKVYEMMRKAKEAGDAEAVRFWRHRAYDLQNIPHPLTGIHVTEKGLDVLEEYVHDVRETVGYEVPLAIDHFGHLGLEDCIKLCRRIEKYNLAWAEDLIPWQRADQYAILRRSTTVPICTGEDVYLKEGFKPLFDAQGVAVIHPDVLSTGGILETKKISDMAADAGVAMAIHMAESPIGCLAAVHAAAASENFTALEFHSVDHPEWNDIYDDGLPKPLVQNGYITVPERPGLGIDTLNDEVLARFVNPAVPGMWEPTDLFDDDPTHDRTWS
ncbi:MAG: mandelate racemase/muconate lactonizing enzyme family protein [Clostridia bacterium]|nr:mandelate racemase/muconate lactonizing enzyme family protein [Clostridia bacterium]